MENLSYYTIYTTYTVYGVDRVKEFNDVEEYFNFVNKGYCIYLPDNLLVFTYEDGSEEHFKNFNFQVALNKIKKHELA